MKNIEKNHTLNAELGIALEESASTLTQGGGGHLFEGPMGRPVGRPVR